MATEEDIDQRQVAAQAAHPTAQVDELHQRQHGDDTGYFGGLEGDVAWEHTGTQTLGRGMVKSSYRRVGAR